MGAERGLLRGSGEKGISQARKTVVIMQPYFFPYAGYFRLFSLADQFVIFDCVQFPRRGRVHRTEVEGPGGGMEWLTLPLARQRQDVLIRDLAFADDARARFDQSLARLPWLRGRSGPDAEQIREFLYSPLASVVDYLEAGLRMVNSLLGITTDIIRSSSLYVDPSVRGQQRVLQIAAACGASRYLNAPGGRELYDEAAFRRSGIALEFLPPYHGAFYRLLQSLLMEGPDRIRAELKATVDPSTDGQAIDSSASTNADSCARSMR